MVFDDRNAWICWIYSRWDFRTFWKFAVRRERLFCSFGIHWFVEVSFLKVVSKSASIIWNRYLSVVNDMNAWICWVNSSWILRPLWKFTSKGKKVCCVFLVFSAWFVEGYFSKVVPKTACIIWKACFIVFNDMNVWICRIYSSWNFSPFWKFAVRGES